MAVVVLAATAGCNGLVGGEPGASTETITPAPVPEVGPGPGDAAGGLAPGLATGGVTDVATLAGAHRSAIRGRSYAWRANQTTRGVEGVAFRTDVDESLVVESEERYRYRTNSRSVRTGGDWHFALNYVEYGDGRAQYRRYVPADGNGTRRYERQRFVPPTDRWATRATEPLHRYLPLDAVTVRRTRIDGDRYYRLTGNRSSVGRFDDVRDFEARAFVAPSGFVRSLNVTFRARNGTVRRSYSFRYERLGTAPVAEPDWVERHWSD